MYTEKVMDHFQHPRNVGEIENASGVGTVGNAKCGDIMRIYLDIDENQIIQDVKFKTFGCGAAVATSSMATELVKGKTIQVSGRIDRIDTVWGTPYIYLKADDYGFTTVSCRFDKKDTDKLATLSKNDSVTIRGICDGESFLSVILDECSLVR